MFGTLLSVPTRVLPDGSEGRYVFFVSFPRCMYAREEQDSTFGLFRLSLSDEEGVVVNV